uniref:Reverse transcriptase domain-containing protein n=1 Tax=Lutzomyia longipalpis TaxID=7200 RepID=A0A1B0CNV0_LUTLO
SLGSGLIHRRRPKPSKPDNDLRIFSWNVRSLYRARAAAQLADTLSQYKADITAIQEMRWTGQGVLEKRDYNIYYSCHPKHHMLGVGFLVSRKVKPAVIGFKPISERLCTLRVRGKFQNISLINVHAPTEDSSESEKDNLYDLVEQALNACPRYDVKIVLGDMNAKIGREPVHRRYTGDHSLHENSNDNGQRIINLAAAHNLVVGSTRFARKNIYKATWASPDGITFNQIDHVLIDRRHQTSLLNVRTFRGANVDSDHFLVGAVFRARVATFKGVAATKSVKINIEALKNEQLRAKYAEEVDAALANNASGPGDGMPINDIASSLEGLHHPGLGRKADRNDWFDDECKLATEQKNAAYRAMLSSRTRSRVESYRDLRRKEKKVHRRKKEAWEKELVCELEGYRKQPHQARRFYQRVRGMKPYTPKCSSCRDKQGNLVSDQEGILERWAEHFDELLNGQLEDEVTIPHLQANNDMLDPPSMDETMAAIRRLKHNRAPGPDGIASELLQCGGDRLHSGLHQLVLRVWDEEVMPADWKIGVICPIFKKGDITKCSQYRGITLLSTAYKIFSSILLGRIAPYAQAAIGNYQCGFTPGKSTADQIFSLRQCMEKMREYDQVLHHLFIDFKAAYDSIARVKLYVAMRELGIPEKLIRLTRMTMTDVRSRVKVDGSLSREFHVKNGLRQGDGLSCVLFNLALEKAIRDSGVRMRGTILNKSTQLLAYADDIDIMGRNSRDVKESFTQIERSAQDLGLHINEDKTKYMVASSAKTPTTTPTSSTENIGQVEVGNYRFEVVESFVYLGSTITADNNTTTEVRARLSMKVAFLRGRAQTIERISR